MSDSGGQFSEGSRLSSNLKRRGLHSICTALSEKLNGESSSSIMELDPATLNLGSVEGRVITSVSHGTANAPVVLAAALSNIAEHSYAAKPTAGTSSNGSKAGKASANGEDPSSSSSSDSSSSDSETEEVATKEVASGPAKAIITVAPPVNTEGQVKSTPRLRSQPVKYVDEMQKFQGSSSKGTSTPSTAQQKATPKTGGGSTSRGRPIKAARQTVESEKKKPETEHKRRGRGCGQCEGCLREDCGTCTFCRDKPKFGGPGTKKQKCALRVCSNFVKKFPPSAHARTDTPSSNSSMTVDLRSFINKTPSTAGTTPTTAGTTPIVTVSAGGTPTTTKSTQAPKVVAKVLSKSTAGASTSAAAAKTGTPSAVTPAQQATASPKKGDNAISEATMKCVQCGRERKVGMARTDKFCTQRCIINWLEAHPEKNVDDAMGVGSPEAPLSIASVQSLSSPAKGETAKKEKDSVDGGGKPKAMSRALKNLQIDMALPGTKLLVSNADKESDDEGEGRSRKRPRIAAAPQQLQQMKLPGVGTRSTRRGAQTSPTKPVKSATTTPVAAVKTGGVGGGKKSTQSPAQPSGSGTSGKATTVKATPVASGGNIKRLLSASAPHPPALKKAKTGGGSSTPSKPSTSGAGPKAVTFNLGFVQSSQKGQPTPTFSLVPIDQLSAPLGGTLINQQNQPVSVPDGLSSNVRSWSMDDVMTYFRSTSDCKDFCDVFAEQEVDGTALLLLTHEALVKCLGIKLGRAVKIMAHVEALKRFYEKSQ